MQSADDRTENFEDQVLPEDIDSSTENLLPSGALEAFDSAWWSRVNPTWMDLIGEYAGTELFVIDGDSLCQVILNDPLLALGRPKDNSFQIMHATWILEKTLIDFAKRRCNFDIVFFEENSYLVLPSADLSPFSVSSRLLARTILKHHLSQLNIQVYQFANVDDPSWTSYVREKGPMFLMCNDGGVARRMSPSAKPPQQPPPDPSIHSEDQQVVVASTLLQRTFVFDILSQGISVAILETADFRDAKILTFVYNQRRGISERTVFPDRFWKARPAALAFLAGIQNSPTPQTSPSHNFSSALDWIKTSACHFIQVAASKGDSIFPATITGTILYLFIAHVILLPELSLSDRAQNHPSLDPKLEEFLRQQFLPEILSSLNATLARGVSDANWRPDIDGRVFLRLVAFYIKSPSTALDSVSEGVAEQVTSMWKSISKELGSASPLISSVDLSHLAQQFSPVDPEFSKPETSTALFKVLPFQNPAFDEHFSTIHLAVEGAEVRKEVVKKAPKVAKDDWDDDSDEEEDEDDWEADADAEEAAEDMPRPPSPGQSMSAFSKSFANSDRGIYQDDKLRHLRRKPLVLAPPKPTQATTTSRGASTATSNTAKPVVSAARLKKRAEKKNQRYMAQLHRQAETLTGAKGARFKQQAIPVTNVLVETLNMKAPYVSASKLANPSTSSTGRTLSPVNSRDVTPVGSRATSPLSRDASPMGVARGGKEVKEKKGGGKPGSKKGQATNKREALLAKIMVDKQKAASSDTDRWWSETLKELNGLDTIDKKKDFMQSLTRNKRLAGSNDTESWLPVEVALYKLNLELDRWIKDPKRTEKQVVIGYIVNLLRMIKDIYELPGLHPKAINLVRSLLDAMGFSQLAPHAKHHPTTEDRALTFPFIAVSQPNARPVYPFLTINEKPIDFQLNHFGLYMDRSMDSAPDPRVTFDADGWQRKVLDRLDARESVLVVAPTSAGKTFISFYAMEQVLSESDDGVLIYVSPTKALVNQIAAEVLARFSKDLKSGSLWAAHTGDYAYNNPEKAQIVILVPEMLSRMLLSPTLARVWTPRIRWIIFDEIHSIGQQDGGSVWEQLILLSPCPIIGLSATIGNPEEFNGWLRSVQLQHGFNHNLIQHKHRYSHLRKFFYPLSPNPAKFEGLDVAPGLRPSQQSNLQFIHPVSVLGSGTTTIPDDLALESRDCFTLFHAMKGAAATGAPAKLEELKVLEPSVFFSKANKASFLQQQDIVDYEKALKVVLSSWMSDPGTGQALVQDVVSKLAMAYTATDQSVPSQDMVLNNIMLLLTELHQRNELPAILFNFDRKVCDVIVEFVTRTLQRTQSNWRENNAEWKAKVADWERWQSRAKLREKDAEKLRKAKLGEGQGREDVERKAANQDRPWQDSFDPDDPNPQFSFASEKTSYSKEELKEDIEDLRWADVPEWALDALSLGVAVHHSGMSRRYRALVESLFRIGFLRVVVSTTTLALGINAPCKTTVFVADSPYLTALNYRQCAGRAGRRGFDLLGNVIFYAIPIDRVHQLIKSKIPPLTGNMPLTTTLTLRLCNLLYGSNDSSYAVAAAKTVLELPQLSVGSESTIKENLHYTRFLLDYLRRSNLIDAQGQPKSLYNIVAQLYPSEPSNLAFSLLMRSGVVHRICSTIDVKPLETKRGLVHLLAHLFGRKQLPRVIAKTRPLASLRQQEYGAASKVVLAPLPDDARKVLQDHDAEILRIFRGYMHTYATQYASDLGADNKLPFSGESVSPGESTSSPFVDNLRDGANTVVGMSAFVANSGQTENSVQSIEDLTGSARSGIHLNKHAVPTMEFIVGSESSVPLNAYLLDFFIHGQVEALVQANRLRRGEIWFLLQEFSVALATIQDGLEKLMRSSGTETLDADDEEGGGGGVDDLEGREDVEDIDARDDGDVPSGSAAAAASRDAGGSDAFPNKPDSLSLEDWNVYKTVVMTRIEFDAKFKQMWA